MASWFGSFSAGFSKGIVEQIAEKEKEQAAMTAASIKNMYHNVQEKKKEIAKQADEYRGIVSELGTFTFKDGAKFDDRQLITLASSPEIAKDIVKRLRDDTELSKRLTPDFFKAAANAPTGVKASDYMDQLFTVRAMAEDKTKALFNTSKEGGGIVDNLVAGNGYAKAQKAAAAYGVTLEQLVGYQNLDTKRTPSLMGEMDYSQLAKTKGYEQVKGELILQHTQTPEGPDKDKLAKQLAGLAASAAMAEAAKPISHEQEMSNLINQIQNAKSKEEASLYTARLNQRKALYRNPKETDQEKQSYGNAITTIGKAYSNTLIDLVGAKSDAFIWTSDINGNLNATPSKVDPGYAKQAMAQAKIALIPQFTKPDGTAIDDRAKNGLISIGVFFDRDGKVIKPEVVYLPSSGSNAPPAAGSPRLGAPRPAPAPAAPAAPAPAASVTPAVPPRFAAPQSIIPLASYDPATGTWK
jgi:hypothetical protein